MPRDASDERAEIELLKLYEQREILARSLKDATPDNRIVANELLRQTDRKIEEYEASIADVQGASSKLDKALNVRRQHVLDLLKTIDHLEKEPTAPKAVLDGIPDLREKSFKFLREDAEERGIPNDDH